MNNIWTSLTAITVATAMQPLHLVSARIQPPADQNTPKFSILAVTELPTQDALPQLTPNTSSSNLAPVKQATVFSFVNESDSKLSITAAMVGSMFKQYQEEAIDPLPPPSKFMADKILVPTPQLSNPDSSSTLDLPELTAPEEQKVLATQIGGASWYGYEGGTVTATGERYNPRSLSAAHRTLPFGTKVMVTNIRNNQSVIVRINNRGPFIRGRIIDLSEAAAEAVGIKSTGVGKVRVDVLSYGNNKRKGQR